MKMTFAGANDPNFHLYRTPAYILREKNKKDHTFASVLESHGHYDLQSEQSFDLTASCTSIELLVDTKEYTVAKATFQQGKSVVLCIANDDNYSNTKHSAGGYKWKGAYSIVVE